MAVAVAVAGAPPGDFVIERENVRLYLPPGTSPVVGVVLSVIFRFFNRQAGARNAAAP